MGKFTFTPLSLEKTTYYLPQMFRILHTNMSVIAPLDTDYEEDFRMWREYLEPALAQGSTHVILMLAGSELAGYFQYSLRGDTLMAEEVEIRSDYQRSMLFFRFGQYFLGNLPEGIRYVESYVNKENKNSLSIHSKLGMEIVGENKSGRSWHLRGSADGVSRRFRP